MSYARVAHGDMRRARQPRFSFSLCMFTACVCCARGHARSLWRRSLGASLRRVVLCKRAMLRTCFRQKKESVWRVKRNIKFWPSLAPTLWGRPPPTIRSHFGASVFPYRTSSVHICTQTPRAEGEQHSKRGPGAKTNMRPIGFLPGVGSFLTSVSDSPPSFDPMGFKIGLL